MPFSVKGCEVQLKLVPEEDQNLAERSGQGPVQEQETKEPLQEKETEEQHDVVPRTSSDWNEELCENYNQEEYIENQYEREIVVHDSNQCCSVL